MESAIHPAAPPEAGRSRGSLAEDVCRRIADEIVLGQLAPGTRLVTLLAMKLQHDVTASAAGTVAAEFDPDHVDVSFNGIGVFVDGQLGADRAEVDLTGRDVVVDVNLHAGEATATIWTNDLTYDYVKENAEYST